MTPRELEIALIKAAKPEEFCHALVKSGIEQVRYNYNNDFKEVEFQINNPNSGYMAFAQVLSLLSEKRHRWFVDNIVERNKPEFKHKDSIFHVDIDTVNKVVTTGGRIYMAYIKQNDPIYFTCAEFKDCELPELIDKAANAGVVKITIPFEFDGEVCGIKRIEFSDKKGHEVNFTETTLWSPYAIADEILSKYVYRAKKNCVQGQVVIDVVNRKHEIDCYGEIIEYNDIETKRYFINGQLSELIPS